MADATVVIPIQGMTCSECVKTITDALQQVDGVRNVEVSLPEKKATVVYDDSACKSTELQAVIETEGYTTSP